MTATATRADRELVDRRIEKLKEFRRVGEQFRYLGKDCVVTGHREIYPIPGSLDSACIKFDYVDDHGTIQHGTVYYPMLEALKKENHP